MHGDAKKKFRRKKWLYKYELFSKYFESVQFLKIKNNVNVTVIIISWRLHEDTERCMNILDSLKNQNYELVFVDNGGEEGEFNSLKPYIDIYVKLNTNTGACISRNIGAVFANAPILLFLEDDGIPDIDLILSHRMVFCNFDVIAVRGACLQKTYNPLNDRQSHYYLGNELFPCFSDLEGNSSYLSDTFFSVGGWDDNIIFGGEGLDLAIRLLEVEPDLSKQVYSPAPIIFHDYARDESHLKEKRKKQKDSLIKIRSKHLNLDECIKRWQSVYRNEDIVKKKNEDIKKYLMVRDRVINRNYNIIHKMNYGIIERFDIKAIRERRNQIKSDARLNNGHSKLGVKEV